MPCQGKVVGSRSQAWVSNLHGKPNYACILLVFANDILENSRMYDATLKKFCSFFFQCIEKIDSMLPWVCTVIDYKRCQMWQEHKLSTRLCLVCHFFVLNAFDIICDLFLSRLRVHGLYTSNERRLGSCILLP